MRGRMTAIVGPNGSGKSTLVRALLGRQPLVSGRVTIDGADLAELDRGDVARRVAVVTQREELAFPTPVRDYVALGRFPHRGVWRGAVTADRDAIARAVAQAGIAPLLDRTVDTLSGGEWQRVRIARALAQGGEPRSCSTSPPRTSTSRTKWRRSNCSAGSLAMGWPSCS